IAYYREIALVMLPYLADRPQVLHRQVDGHSGKVFYQRVSWQRPQWLQLVRLSIDGGRRMRDFDHLDFNSPQLETLARSSLGGSTNSMGSSFTGVGTARVLVRNGMLVNAASSFAWPISTFATSSVP